MSKGSVDIAAEWQIIEKAFAALSGEQKTKRLYPINFDGSDCVNVQQLAIANRVSEFKAAVMVLESPSAYLPEAVRDARRFVKELQPGPPSNSEGVAIVLTFDANVAAQIAMQGGEPPHDLHCTLGFFGNKTNFIGEFAKTNERPLIDVCADIARQFPKFVAQLNGITRFSGEESDPLVLNVDSPRIEQIRRYMLDQLSDAGITTQTEHGFTPHCTLGYLKPEDPMPLERWTPITVAVTGIELWFGKDRSGHHLGDPNNPYMATVPDTKDVYMGPGSFPRRRNTGRRRQEIIERARRFDIRTMEKKK